MSRLLSSFVFFLFAATHLCFGQLNVNFSTATPNPGQTVQINVSVSNFVDIELFQFGIGWDSTVASFVSIANVTNVLPQFSEANNIGTPTNAALIDDGELSLSWSLNSTEPVSIPDGTVLFTILVEIAGTACDETTFMVTTPPIGGIIEVFTDNLSNNIGATSSGGLVSIPGTDCEGGGMDGVGLIGSMESGLTGTQVCVNVTTENFDNIASLQTGIVWNPSILSFVNIQENAISGISLNENQVGNGELKLLWIIGLGDDPVTLGDGANLFDICFDIIGSEGQMSNVSFVDLPNFKIEVANGDGISIDYYTQNGKVTVGEGGGGGETCDTGVGLIGDSLTVSGVTNVCVPVTSKDFANIASVQTGIVWNESILAYTGVNEGALSGISVNALNVDMGELKLLWIIGLGDDPVTVADGTVLFELCFDILGVEGQSSSISFTDLPNFNIEIANGDGIAEEYCTITGFVDLNEGGGGGGETCDTGVGLIGDSLTVSGVTNVCVPVTSKDFANIASVQTGIVWNESILAYTGVNEGALSGISVNALNVDMGELKLLWIIGLGDDPVTVADGTVLFELCFDILGVEGQSSSISFVDLPNFNIEIANGDGIAEEYCTITGFVDLNDDGGGGGETCDIGVGLIGDSLSTAGVSNICVPVTSKDFANIASVQSGIAWDESILSYTGVNEAALTGISINALNAGMGNLRLLWIIGLSDDPVTVADGTVLFELCFDVLGAEGTSSSVSFVDLPNFEIEVANGNGMAEEHCTITGFVEVTGDGGGGGETCDIGVGLIGDSLSTNGLTNICIPVTSKDFSNIVRAQTGVEWNVSVLKITGVNEGALSDISVNGTSANMGRLRLSWNIGLGEDPVTVPDGTVLFELCFDVVGSEGTSSSISFVDLPNFNIEIENSNSMLEEYCTITGFVEVTPDDGGGGETCDIGVGLIADSISTQGLTNVCVSVISKDFTNIASVQSGIVWNESILDYTGVNDGALSGISVNALNVDMGELKLLWIIGLGDDPVTVPDGTVLFEMCFDVLGAEGTTSSVSFVDLPNFDIEIANGNGMAEEYCTITGFVEVTPDDGGGGETCDNGVGLIADSISTQGLTNICVSVTSKDFTNIASVQSGIVWNESILDYTGVNDGALSGISVNALNVDMGELKLLWIIGLGDDPVTVPDGTVLFEMCFDVLGAEGTTSSVSFVDLPNFDIEIANGNGMAEEYCTITGFVEVTPDDGGGGETCDVGVGLIGDSLNTNGLTNICVPVTSKDFSDIIRVQTGVEWNESVLDLTGVNDGALSDISLNGTNANMGELKLSWNIGLGEDPVTVSDGTVLFELCFDVIGSEGTSSSISFVDLTNFNIEIENSDSMLEEFCTITGFVNITAAGVEDCEVGVGIIGDTLTVDLDVGPSFCMPITTKNFENIASLQTGIAWDPSVITFTSINELNLTGVSLNTTNAASGSLRFLWIIGLGDDPLTLNDGDTLFEICFDAVGEGGDMSDVSFVDLENFDVEIANGNGIAEDVCLIPGHVTLEDIDPPSDFSLIANNVSADQGTETCIDVDVTGFKNIQSTQFTVTWDASVLNFKRVEMLNSSICMLTQNNFFPVGQNKLRVSWSCTNGSTVPDSTLFFKVCFNVIGECNPASTSSISFINDPPIEIEITDTNNNEIDPVLLVSGSVSVNECPEEFMCILNAVDNVKCKGDASGGIFVDFSGAVGNVSCAWVGPNGPYTDCDLQGIRAGVYTLTATDEGGNSCTMEVEVAEPSEELSLSGQSSAATCGQGGSINVSVSGGTGNYAYNWDPDLGGVEDPSGLTPGEYCLTVTDENDCTENACFTVEDSAPTLSISSANTTNINCGTSGAIDIEIAGGCTPVSYNWTFNGISIGLNQDLSGLEETGTYTVNISDSSNPVQQISRNYIITSDIEVLTISTTTTTNISCGRLGSIDISVDGGCAPISYTWSFKGNEISTSQDLTELKEAGTYKVIITEGSTPVQQVTMDFVITSSVTALNVSGRGSDLSCNGDMDGSIDITVSGGCPSYVFVWDNGETSEDLSGLSAGTYCVSVNDQFCPGDDPIVMCFDIEEPVPVTIDLIGIQHVTNLSGNNGVIDIEPVGGAGGFTFAWTPSGSVSEDQINMPPGEYCVTVTDANDCTATACYTIEWAAVFLDNCLATPSDCSGECTGAIDCDIVGGCSGVEIRVNNVLIESFPITGLCANTYTIQIVDDCGNMDSEVIIIPEPGDMILDTIEVRCTNPDELSGSIEIDIDGGIEPYTITWGGASSCDGSTICEGLGVGFYTVVVEDGNGCQAIIQNIEIAECDNSIPSDCYEGRPIITPNGDGLNDQFIITCADGTNNADLQVYDRWGRLVFEQNNYDSTWEGTHLNGTLLDDGGYMWVLSVSLPNGDTILRNGSLTILRTNF